MTSPEPVDQQPTAEEFAPAFERLFAQAYLHLHRRDGKRSAMSGASRAVLLHLAHTGPLTVGEAAKHLDRAQSVVSDIVTQLEQKGFLAREPDPADRRRTLVWLTPDGRAALDRERSVLSPELVRQAADALPAADRAALLDLLGRLLHGGATAGPTRTAALDRPHDHRHAPEHEPEPEPPHDPDDRGETP